MPVSRNQLVVLALGGCVIAVGVGLLFVPVPTNDEPSTPDSNQSEWVQYEDTDIGVQLRYPPEFSPVNETGYPYGIPGNATTIFKATQQESVVKLGHTDTSVDGFASERSGETVLIGEESQVEFSPFTRSSPEEPASYTFERTWYAGTGAGTDGISCNGLGAIFPHPSNQTVYLFVERCGDDISSQPRITGELRRVFTNMTRTVTVTPELDD